MAHKPNPNLRGPTKPKIGDEAQLGVESTADFDQSLQKVVRPAPSKPSAAARTPRRGRA